jgi:hypothetical protein
MPKLAKLASLSALVASSFLLLPAKAVANDCSEILSTDPPQIYGDQCGDGYRTDPCIDGSAYGECSFDCLVWFGTGIVSLDSCSSYPDGFGEWSLGYMACTCQQP